MWPRRRTSACGRKARCSGSSWTSLARRRTARRIWRSPRTTRSPHSRPTPAEHLRQPRGCDAGSIESPCRGGAGTMSLLGFEGENAREKVLVLLTMCFALAMAMLDNTVVNVALPTISRELDAGVSELQWIVDGYVLAFASLLLTGGILGDRYGRKRMFLAGLTLFTLASLACGLSPTSSWLIAFRGIQGIGGALLMPGPLSIITVTFPPHERAKAIGLW